MTSCHEEFKFIILTLTLWTVSLIIAMTIHLPPIESYETSPNEIKQQLKKKALTKKIKETKSHSPKGKNKNNKKQQKKNNKGKKNCSKKSPKKQVEQELTIEEQGRYVALDCEFVGVGPGGYKSALARVSMVDYENAVLIDTYVKVNEPVTDYRTFVSGITEEHLKSDLAMDADKCIDLVQRLLRNKILVGHGLKNDLSVLGIDHSWEETRDTAKYEPFMKKSKQISASTLPRPRKLKDLALTKLNREIQKEGQPHCSIEDAIAALDLYKKARTKWESAMTYKIDRTRQIEFFDMILQSDE
jgi:RNA exonuclease 4